jgi:hypothetical protein
VTKEDTEALHAYFLICEIWVKIVTTGLF